MIFLFNNILKEFSFYLRKFCSSKFIRKGKCNQCGRCCRNIVFLVNKETIKTEEQFEKLKKLHKHYYNFYISGIDEDNSLLFTCKSLTDDNKCKDYKYRSLFCRTYPKLKTKFLINGGKPLEGCGFYFDINKKFDQFLQ